MVRDQDQDQYKTAETKIETTKIGLETYSPASCFQQSSLSYVKLVFFDTLALPILFLALQDLANRAM